MPGRAPLRVSERFECARCRRGFVEPQPRLFSFNNPFGACPSCHGFGNLIEVDLDLVVPDKHRSLSEGAIEPWNRPHYRSVLVELRRFARRRGIPLDVPWSFLDEGHRRLVLEGDEEFPGILGFFRWLEGRKYRVQVRAFLARYRGYQECPGCGGSRLRPEALRVRLGGLSIRDVAALSVGAARRFLRGLSLSPQEEAIAGRVRHEADRRLSFLEDVGLDYLNLDRPTATLSGGESQRIALAAALGTGLVGTLFVLDEPSVGLHPRDTERLIGILKALRDQGNTVVVVEHDPAIVTAADHVIDLGPGAGEQGGRVVYQGPAEALGDEARSLTAKYLRGDLRIPVPARRRRGSGLFLNVRGATLHNLKGIDARFPLGAFTVVTGVSGSGKSTLVHDVLCARLRRRRGAAEGRGGPVVEGADYVEQLEVVDQSPLGRSPRSNPVTYMKAFDAIRELFAATPEARRRGLGAAAFSFNMPGGRCEACGGDGRVRVDLQFLADAWLVCESCGGRRYRAPVLEVRWRGRSVDQVLDLTVHEALHFFAGHHAVTRRLKVLEQIGLGYLRLGQPASTLSGGRGPEGEARGPPAEAPGAARPLRARRADDGAAHGRRGRAPERAAAAAGRRRHPRRHRAQPARDQAGRLGDRPRARGRARRAARSSSRARRRPSPRTARGTPRGTSGRCWSRPRTRPPERRAVGSLTVLLLSSRIMAMQRSSVQSVARRLRLGSTAALVIGLAWGLAPVAGAEQSFEDLVANLKSPTARTRQEAARELGNSRRREAVAPLSALVRDPEVRVRLEVVKALRNLRDLSAVPALVTSLQDGDPGIREEAIGTLVEIYSERDRGGPIDSFLETFSDEYDRASVPPYTAVDPSVFRGLAGTLRDEKKGIRAESAYAIGILGGGSAVPELVSATQDPESDVRGAAATAIGKVGTAEEGKSLVPLLADESATVRNRALQAIGVLRVREAGPALREMFEQHRRRELGTRVLASLSRIGDPAQADLFRELLSSSDPEHRRLAVEGLGRIADPSTLPCVQEGLPAREGRRGQAGLQLRDRLARGSGLPRRDRARARLLGRGGPSGPRLHPGAGTAVRAGPLPLPERPGPRGARRALRRPRAARRRRGPRRG